MSDSTACVGGALGLASGGDVGERFEAARSKPEHAKPLAMMNDNARTRRNVRNSNLGLTFVFRVGADCGRAMVLLASENHLLENGSPARARSRTLRVPKECAMAKKSTGIITARAE
jgi:hypothetical protein